MMETNKRTDNINEKYNTQEIDDLYHLFAKTRVFNEEGNKVIDFDKSLRNKIAENNKELVPFVVDKFYRKSKNNREELIQEGYMGLLESIPRFEPEKGFKFSTYSTYWVKQAISSYLTENKVGPFVPLHVRVAFKKLLDASKAEGINTQEYISKHPKIKEELGITPNMLNSIRASRATEHVSSLEELQEKSSSMLNDPNALVFSDKTDKDLLICSLKETFKELSYKQQKIILLRFNLI